MNLQLTIVMISLGYLAAVQIPSSVTAQEATTAIDGLTLEQVKAAGALKSRYRRSIRPANSTETLQANLSNLFVTMLQRLGVEADTFADNTGTLSDV